MAMTDRLLSLIASLALFCALVGYHNPMFIDEHYSKKTRFGGRIVPSSLTMSFSTAMTEWLRAANRPT